MHARLSTAIVAAGLACAHAPSMAQSIQKAQESDAQLTCAQLNAESVDMDKAIASAKEAESSGNTKATAGTAGNAAAEVANATGVFGQIGGLAGSLFGKAASQAAANNAKQSGEQAAAQAQEQAKQAQARKDHVAAVFGAKGCKSDDLAFEPAPTDQTTTAVAAVMTAALPKKADPAELAKLLTPAEKVALPANDPDAHFKGRMGGTFGKEVKEVMPNSKRVAVTGFRVVFVTENTASAQVRASYLPGRDTSGASSTYNLKLAGVDAAVMQRITDKAYADFMAQLKLAGREVVPQEELKEFFSGVQASSGEGGKPYVKAGSGTSAVVMAPTGMPLWFSHADGTTWGDKSPFDQSNHKRTAEYSAKLNAIAVAPLIVVNFAAMKSSGNQSGLTSRAAETGAELKMHVAAFSTAWVRTEEFRNGMLMKGDEGGVQMAAPIASTLEFGTIKEVAASDNSAAKGIFDTLGKSMGLANAGGANRSKTERVAETSDPAYAAAAVDALGTATGTFAKWFEKYPAK